MLNFTYCLWSIDIPIVEELSATRTPMETTYDEIVKTFKTYFNPKSSPIIQRFKFNTRDRDAKESLANNFC